MLTDAIGSIPSSSADYPGLDERTLNEKDFSSVRPTASRIGEPQPPVGGTETGLLSIPGSRDDMPTGGFSVWAKRRAALCGKADRGRRKDPTSSLTEVREACIPCHEGRLTTTAQGSIRDTLRTRRLQCFCVPCKLIQKAAHAPFMTWIPRRAVVSELVLNSRYWE